MPACGADCARNALVTACFALCWLGVGVWYFAGKNRVSRGFFTSKIARSGLRALGTLALLAAPCAQQQLRLALALVAALVICMAVSSIAGLVGAMAPRWYAWSLPLSACLAAAFAFAL